MPVLPSVTVTSLMRTDGGGGGRPGLVVDQHRDVAAVVIGRGDIEPAVAVEVAGRHAVGLRAGGEVRRRRERAIAAGQGARSGRCESEFAVATSSLPSPLKSPSTTAAGYLPAA